MEEDKIQKLHDSLSKLRRGKGLGISSHYNFGGGNNVDNGNGVSIKENEHGEFYREDGLPVNALYANFLKQGSYSKTDSALKYGDGRKIKRNFDDCTPGGEERDGDSDSSSAKAAKKRKKAEKKALKKAEKMEAKKKAKREEKKRAKLEAKKREKLEAKRKAKLEAKETISDINVSPDFQQCPEESKNQMKKEKKLKKKAKDEKGAEINKNKKDKKKQKKKSKAS